jgi:hypothetical protein
LKETKFLEPAFLGELAAKTMYYGLPILTRPKDRNVLSTNLPESECLVSSLYLYRYLQLAVERGDAPPPEPGPFFGKVEALASAFLLYVLRSGDPEPLRRLAGKLKLIEKHLSRDINWHFITGVCASSLLWRGIVPPKKLLRERAKAMAGKNGKQSPTPRHWVRIFADLGLSGLPAASTRPRRADIKPPSLQ